MRTALVTGGSGGIGKAISSRLAIDGYHVIIHYRNNFEEAERTSSSIQATGGSCELVRFDITSNSEVQKNVNDLLASHRIDVLVLNAGIRQDGLFALMTLNQWKEVIDTNLMSFYYITKPIVKQMLLNRRGSVVVISSTSGQSGLKGQTNYAASKAGLLGATKALALECAPRNVLVNALTPGLIETQMTKDLDSQKLRQSIPLNRFGKPEEVAGVVSFLCSKDSRYITGQVIAVNGGLYT